MPRQQAVSGAHGGSACWGFHLEPSINTGWHEAQGLFSLQPLHHQLSSLPSPLFSALEDGWWLWRAFSHSTCVPSLIAGASYHLI